METKEKETPKPVSTDDYIRSAHHNSNVGVSAAQATQLSDVLFQNSGEDFPYDDVLAGFIHRIGGDKAATDKYKDTPMEDVILMLPILSKKLTEYQGNK